jgi:hypothetical protein
MVTQDDEACIINPLSSIHDRYQLHSSSLQRQMIKNNVNQKFLLKKKKNPQAESPNTPVQNFYLNPEYKERVFTIPPRQNLTIREAVIFEPQVIEQQFNQALKMEIDKMRASDPQDPSKISAYKNSIQEFETSMQNVEMRATPMQLLIKNNLTVIEQINLEGYGTSGLLELTDIKKQMLEPPDFMYGESMSIEHELVSVSKTHSHRLMGMQHISPH